MSYFFTPHARERAKERHGPDLSIAEMSRIMRLCETGKAPVVRSHEDGTVHFAKVGTNPVYPVIRDGMIITFLPAKLLLASTGKLRRKTIKGRGMARRIGRPDTPQPYRRARSGDRHFEMEAE
jgi:hypothetical protein